MEAYTDFATVYSHIMQDTPYDTWEKFLVRTLKKNGIRDGLVLDLGCGTGEMTRRLQKRGYDMIGVDVSTEMLQIATAAEHEGILYLNQDMREFELYGTVRAIVSVCDSMNYLTDSEDFLTTLKLVNNYLDPKGIFIFDLKTVHFFRDVAGESVFGENLEDCSYIWENYFDNDSKINEYALFLADNYDLSLNQERKHARQRYLLIGAGALLGLLVMGWVLLQLRKTNNQQRRAYDQEREAFDQQLNEAQSAIERQTFENLQRQAREVLSRGSQRKRIIEAFNATYPKAYERLKTTYPDLSEQEYDLLILNFLEFRIKEEAEILELSQNTVMKYRSNLLKKVGKDPVSAVLNAMPTS